MVRTEKPVLEQILQSKVIAIREVIGSVSIICAENVAAGLSGGDLKFWVI